MAHELMRELIKKGNTVTVLTRQIDNMGSIDATGDMRIIRFLACLRGRCVILWPFGGRRGWLSNC